MSQPGTESVWGVFIFVEDVVEIMPGVMKEDVCLPYSSSYKKLKGNRIWLSDTHYKIKSIARVFMNSISILFS